MKKKLAICVCLVFVTTLVAYQKLATKKNLGSIALQNIEALARNEGDGNCAEWVSKNCYEAFSNEYGTDYYASCAPIELGGMAECGAIVSFRPMGASRINGCLECIRYY